ncbi:MAG: DUF480 domain-containing protein [Gammaproteobacteria bacterium]
MRTELTPLEARVIGCLIEKEITTPDQYPLTLNALVTACNQKSNRDPVMVLDGPTVQGVVDGLMKKHLVTDRSGGMGGRVTRYRHRFCNSHFGSLELAPQELAVVCELLLRGPQTPGELRSRAARLAPFSDVGEVDVVLSRLAGREEPLATRLPRQAGKRESRWAQLFTGDLAPEPAAVDAVDPMDGPTGEAGTLESRVAELEAEVARLHARLEALAAGSAGASEDPQRGGA